MTRSEFGLSPDCATSRNSSTRTRRFPPRCWADLLVFPPDGSDAEMFAEIDVIAALIGVDRQRRRQPGRPLQRGARLRPGAVPGRRHPAQRPQPQTEGRIAMLLHLILGSVALIGAAFTGGLLLAIIGIQRGDRGKRLTGRPAGYSRSVRPPAADRLARLRPSSDAGEAPMSTVTDLTAAVVVSARHCNEIGCDKCRARSRWLRRKAWRSRKSPNRSARDRKR